MFLFHYEGIAEATAGVSYVTSFNMYAKPRNCDYVFMIFFTYIIWAIAPILKLKAY